MSTTYRKKLIEVALPLEAINAACVEDKNRKTGHIRNIHKWFAPMPLPAWRAMLFATLVDDPSNDLPEKEAMQQRGELFRQIEELAPLDAYRDSAVIRRARETLSAATGSNPPTIADPFCGGGSTIVEAQRLGLPTFASDLNPIPVLITTVLCRAASLFAGRSPVSPTASLRATPWEGCEGLLEDVRRYAATVREIAAKSLAPQYPAEKVGIPYAWRWAWAVSSPNPAVKGAYVPLVSDWSLTKQKGNETWISPVPNVATREVHFRIEHKGTPPAGNIGRGGARCLFTDTPISLEHIRAEGKAGRLRPMLLAVAVQRGESRVFVSGDDLPARDAHAVPIEGIQIDEGALGFRVQPYGLTDYKHLFTTRQAAALYAFARAIEGIGRDVLDAARSAFPSEGRSLEEGGDGARAYADAVCAILGLMLGKLAQSNNVLVRWFIDPRNGTGKATPAFDRNAIPMVWDFVETNPFGGSTGDWVGAVQETALKAFDLVVTDASPATVAQADARTVKQFYSSNTVIACDPPYYANIGYADLSDFFFLWQRIALRQSFPRLFGTVATPKKDELVASATRRGGANAARDYFRTGFTKVFEQLAGASSMYPLSIVYALKQTETESETGAAGSTGWDVFLSGLLDAGLSVVATWPIRTTTDTRMRGIGSNALASAIFVVCRKRSEDANSTTRGDFRRLLRKELPDALRKLQQGNIAPVDVAQASIGPGMAIFSRHKHVLEADGTPMNVRSALQLINEVLDEYLASGEGDFDPDTRFAITWYEQHGWDPGPYGDAETLAKARNISVSGVVDAGICRSAAGKVRILRRQEMRPLDYDPACDDRPTVWEFTQHMIRNLEEEGEEAAARLLKKLGPAADATRELAYRLYNTCERRKWAEDGRSYNALILAWPELEKLASRLGDEPPPVASGEKATGKRAGKSAKGAKKQQSLFDGDE